MGTTTAGLVPAVDRALRMLGCFRDPGDAWRLSELSRRLRIPKSSAFQIAHTLRHHGLLSLDADTRRYRLGPAVVQLAARAGLRTDLAPLAEPHLRRLAEVTRRTALLGVFAHDEVVLVGKAEAQEPLGVSAPLGYRLHHSAGAFGKVYHAFLDPAGLDALMRHSPLRRYTRRTVTDPVAYRQHLATVRRRGYALDDEEYLEGIRAVAAPVRDRGGSTVAGMCVVGLAARFPGAELRRAAAAACRAAAVFSRELGFDAGEGRAGAAEARR